MNRCLRCSKPCEATSLFCDTCQSLLHTQLWEEADTLPETPVKTPPIVAMSPEQGEAGSDLEEPITAPQPTVRIPQLMQTPPISPVEEPAANDDGVIEDMLSRLNAAAQRIAQEEQEQEATRRIPRPSRLSPLPEIAIDIQRENTPLPQELSAGKPTEKEEEKDLANQVPDLWPWLHDMDADEAGGDVWANRTDPLLSRQFTKRIEAGPLDEEDMQQAVAAGLATRPLPTRRKSMFSSLFPGYRGSGKMARRIQVAFIALVILAIVALGVDSVLLSVAFIHPRHSAGIPGGPPTLTLSPDVAYVGQTVTLHILHFTPGTQVYVTHDIEETVQLTSGAALIHTSSDGSASTSMLIDASWGPGFHTVQAEDVRTRYTASATLQIAGQGPTPPPHLLLGTSSLDFGAGVEGTNSIQSLTLHNSGGGSISWTASSNQPWLLVAPSQGVFSTSETISVAVQRANLEPGDYNDGVLTFSSNVGPPQPVKVHMTVDALPPNVGAVLVVTPAVLSFTALDGGPDPAMQALTIANPGSQPLQWSLAGNNPIGMGSQDILLHFLNINNSWLSTDQASGVVAPHSSSLVQVMVNSQNLLPGVYTNMLVFDGAQGTYDGPQDVSVALTVEPHCGLLLNTGSISFTAVSGQGNPSDQSVSLSATPSCAQAINWQAVAGANWISVTPSSGQVKGTAKTVTAVGVNAAILKPGTYISNITFVEAQSTQSVAVQLVVQPPPPPSAPIMGAAPLNLNFSTTVGMPNPPGQVVTITNTGGGTLYWHVSAIPLSLSWLGASPSGGSIPPGGTAQVTVTININTNPPLTPNTYVGQVVINGSNSSGGAAAGNPQTVMVDLLVLPPCALAQPSSSALSFSAVQGTGDPAPQTFSITASGNCNWPLSWNTGIPRSASWLKLSPSSGTVAASGQSSTITVAPTIAGLNPGTYTAQISINASDGSSNVQGTPQTVSVTLTVQPPCTLQVASSSLSFTVVQGQSSSQNVSFNETGTCARPVSWTATASNGASWLSVSPASGSDSGSGATVTANVNTTGLQPGTYQGTITISATGNGGAVVQGSPQTVTVTLTVVAGFTLSGTVFACSNGSCTTPLPGATVTLTNAAGQSFTATADGSGNYSFSSVAAGTYTLTATGSINGQNYSGTLSGINVTGNQTGLNIDCNPS